MTIARTCILIAFVACGLVAFRCFTAEPESSTEDARDSELSFETVEHREVITQPSKLAEGFVYSNSESCLAMEQVQSHPSFGAYAKSFEPILVDTPAVESFRNVDNGFVAQLAEQGDSIAMMVMGASAVLRAIGQDEAGAVDWLKKDRWTNKGVIRGKQFSPEQLLDLNDAAFWFYEAALHGRFFALGLYGEVRGEIFGGPVGLGWISAEKYESLDTIGKAALDPMNVHNAVALDLVPELSAGSISVFFDEFPRSDLQDRIRGNLLGEFSQSLSDANLSIRNATPDMSEEFENVIRRSCSYLNVSTNSE